MVLLRRSVHTRQVIGSALGQGRLGCEKISHPVPKWKALVVSTMPYNLLTVLQSSYNLLTIFSSSQTPYSSFSVSSVMDSALGGCVGGKKQRSKVRFKNCVKVSRCLHGGVSPPDPILGVSVRCAMATAYPFYFLAG